MVGYLRRPFRALRGWKAKRAKAAIQSKSTVGYHGWLATFGHQPPVMTRATQNFERPHSLYAEIMGS
jgi:hypothetical protein